MEVVRLVVIEDDPNFLSVQSPSGQERHLAIPLPRQLAEHLLVWLRTYPPRALYLGDTFCLSGHQQQPRRGVLAILNANTHEARQVLIQYPYLPRVIESLEYLLDISDSWAPEA